MKYLCINLETLKSHLIPTTRSSRCTKALQAAHLHPSGICRDRNSHKSFTARPLRKLSRISFGRLLALSTRKSATTSSSKHTSHSAGKQTRLVRALQNSSAAPKMNPLGELLSLGGETLLSIRKCTINKTEEVPEKVLPLHSSSIPTADPRPCSQPTRRFLPGVSQRSHRHRNAMPFPRAHHHQSHRGLE